MFTVVSYARQERIVASRLPRAVLIGAVAAAILNVVVFFLTVALAVLGRVIYCCRRCSPMQQTIARKIYGVN